MEYGLQIGGNFIRNILKPQPEEIDLEEIDLRLRVMHRFSCDPKSLTVYQHVCLATMLATRAGASDEVIQWTRHHDDHEGVITDIPGPLKQLIRRETPILQMIEDALDLAICQKRGIPYPTMDVKHQVHQYDKLAETLEWTLVLGNPLAAWSQPIPKWLDEGTAKRYVNLVNTN